MSDDNMYLRSRMCDDNDDDDDDIDDDDDDDIADEISMIMSS